MVINIRVISDINYIKIIISSTLNRNLSNFDSTLVIRNGITGKNINFKYKEEVYIIYTNYQNTEYFFNNVWFPMKYNVIRSIHDDNTVY